MPKDRSYSLLESIVGAGNVSNEPYTLECYACDSTTNLPSLPNYVVLGYNSRTNSSISPFGKQGKNTHCARRWNVKYGRINHSCRGWNKP